MRVPFAKPRPVSRFPNGSRSEKGRYTPGEPTSVSVRMLVQPWGRLTEADEKMMQAHGVQFVDGMVRVHAEAELYTVRKEEAAQADRFTWQGNEYEVKLCSFWPDPRSHWRCVAQLVDEKTA